MSDNTTDVPLNSVNEPTVRKSIKAIFPDKIKMSGFPFSDPDVDFWNKPFIITDRMSDDYPIYRIEPYVIRLLWKNLPTTKGAEIYRKDGIWVLQFDDNENVSRLMKYGAVPQNDPFGYWSCGKSVAPCYE